MITSETIKANRTSESQESFFRENGYLLVENAYSPDEVDALRRDTADICRGSYGELRGLIPGVPGESDDDVLRRPPMYPLPTQSV
jgi:phytanoyl-CoA hydroxylase